MSISNRLVISATSGGARGGLAALNISIALSNVKYNLCKLWMVVKEKL